MSEPREETRVSTRREAWAWIPTLYIASGLPNVTVTQVAGVMYENLGVAVDAAARYTSDLMTPWVVKPLWSPLVDVLGTQRRWIVVTQALFALASIGVALGATSPNYLVITLAGLWLLAIASATHDIAADGFYMAGLSEKDQAWFVGIRNSLYRIAMIVGAGGFVWASGRAVESFEIPIDEAWSWVFFGVAGFFAALAAYNGLMLPRPDDGSPKADRSLGMIAREFRETFTTFFQKPGIGLALCYLLVYRFSEAQLATIKPFFLLNPIEEGGLNLDNETYGTLNGVIGVVMLLLGGIVGGIVVSRDGLRRWLFPMALAINIPNALYTYLAFTQSDSLWVIGSAIAIESLGYGFGFAGYMLFMLLLSRGKHQTAHYALCTGFMALGYQIPGRFSGDIKEALGYEQFFVWVLIATIPSLLVTLIAPVNRLQSQEESA